MKNALDKPTLIHEIMNGEKINKQVLEELANSLHEQIPTGSSYSLYNKMDERMLESIHRIFVKKETDGKGRFLEFRFANFLMKHSKVIFPRLRIRYKLEGIGEIDIIGFDSEKKPKPLLLAECKDRKMKFEDVDKWIENIRRVFSKYNGSLMEAYLVGSSGYTQETIKRIESSPEIDSKKGFLKMGGVSSRIKEFIISDKALEESGRVFFGIYDVRQNKFMRILPR